MKESCSIQNLHVHGHLQIESQRSNIYIYVTNSLSLLVNPMARSTPNGGDPVRKLLVGSHDAQHACAH